MINKINSVAIDGLMVTKPITIGNRVRFILEHNNTIFNVLMEDDSLEKEHVLQYGSKFRPCFILGKLAIEAGKTYIVAECCEFKGE